MIVDSVRLKILLNVLLSLAAFGWYGAGLVNAIQNVPQVRPLLIRAEHVKFEPYDGTLRRRSSLEAGLNMRSANQFLIRCQEKRKSIVYKELKRISKYVQYLAHDTFLLPLTSGELESVLQIDGVHGEAYYLPSAMKMPNELAADIASDNSAKSANDGRMAVQPIQNDAAFIASDNFAKSANDERMVVQSHQTNGVTIYLVIVAHFSEEDLDYFCQGYNPTCKVRVVTPGKKLALDTDAHNKRSILVRCIAHPMVRWVEEKKDVTASIKFASGIIQGNGNAFEQHHPFWDKNLTGDGEIIGATHL
jgi:hypothetical protein